MLSHIAVRFDISRVSASLLEGLFLCFSLVYFTILSYKSEDYKARPSPKLLWKSVHDMSLLSKWTATATTKREGDTFKKYRNTPLRRTAPNYHWHGHISHAERELSMKAAQLLRGLRLALLLRETSTLHTFIFSCVGFEDLRGKVSEFELMVLDGRKT